ncbi:hypothetical protein CDL12_09633 [Handroanthus impetiginosus]|uniref:Signal recognition particle SRP72 subunit RNA-binding domain-containing protein n=1 Tax=Handroanthus impetiginosus TaxID=429701 RepID=A0A2G9HJI8_9LAMI|nr:hypothetical protein CDL12_09633 [Handroanthus impetiginosus]
MPLVSNQGGEDAIRCRVVALIRNDNIEEALSAIQEFSKKSSIDFNFFNVFLIDLWKYSRSDESYSNIIKKNLVDKSSFAVSISNLITLKDPKDVPAGLMKKCEGPLTSQLALGLDKLSQRQRETIELASVLPGMFPNSVMQVLLQAAVHVRENKANKTEEILWQSFLLTRAQVAAAAGHPQIAAESLPKIPNIQYKPATSATLVSLKEQWSNAMTEDNKLEIIMQEAASFKLRHGKKDEAACLYKQLVKNHGNINALVGLIQTTLMKPFPGLKGMDVESLEKTSGKKAKYPKGFDPANAGPPPDPERWVLKRETSSFRPKRKDKRAAQIKGSQGAVVKEADSNVNSKSNQALNSKRTSQNVSTGQSKASSKSRKRSRNWFRSHCSETEIFKSYH